jgi:tetratricopeptide (TPR) repeat protein
MKVPHVAVAVVLVGILHSSLLRADQKDYLFQKGNDLYRQEKYEEALQAYQEILDMGYESADLYYNIGNAYYKLGEYPRAILFYERALRLRPDDEDIRFNLQLANLSVVDKIPQLPELFYIRLFRQFRDLFSLHTWTWLALGSYFFFAFGLIFWILARRPRIRSLARFIAVFSCGVCLVFSLTFYSKARSMSHNVEAIVMSSSVDVLSAPGESGTEIFTIHAGLKVKIVEESGDWYEIKLPDGKTGWLKKEHLEII